MKVANKLPLLEKCPNTEFFLVRISPHFRMNTERYSVSLRIQSKCRKIRTRKLRIWTLFTQCAFLLDRFFYYFLKLLFFPLQYSYFMNRSIKFLKLNKVSEVFSCIIMAAYISRIMCYNMKRL